MTPFLTLVLAGFLSRVGYQMARSPVLPRFAQDLGAAPELIGIIVAASTVTGVLIKLPAGALSDVLGRKRMMLLGCLFFAGDRKITRLNSSHTVISYAVFCLKKKKNI